MNTSPAFGCIFVYSSELMVMKNALIAGATGLVGKELMQQLLADPAYDKIIVLVRKPVNLQHSRLIQQQVNFDQIGNEMPVIPVDEVYCALGTTIKKAGSQEAFRKVDQDYVLDLGKFCEKNDIRHFLIVSAMGADSASRIFYNRVKGDMEAGIRSLSVPFKSVFRPSLLMGKRDEFRLGERVAQSVMGKLGFLFPGSLKKYKPIHAGVVAAAMIRTAKTSMEPFLVVDSAEMQFLGKLKE